MLIFLISTFLKNLLNTYFSTLQVIINTYGVFISTAKKFTLNLHKFIKKYCHVILLWVDMLQKRYIIYMTNCNKIIEIVLSTFVRDWKRQFSKKRDVTWDINILSNSTKYKHEDHVYSEKIIIKLKLAMIL